MTHAQANTAAIHLPPSVYVRVQLIILSTVSSGMTSKQAHCRSSVSQIKGQLLFKIETPLLKQVCHQKSMILNNNGVLFAGAM
jgi:hypothetical protein